MRIYSLALLIGILLFQQLPILPDAYWTVCMIPCAMILRYTKSCVHRAIIIVVLGFLWTLLRATLIIGDSDTIGQLQGKDIIVIGVVDSVPFSSLKLTRFEFNVEHYIINSIQYDTDFRVRLNWYADQKLTIGDRWQLKVRLKRPNGFMNTGGFDYEGWLYQNRILATGYVKVKSAAINRKLGTQSWTGLSRWRQSLLERLSSSLQDLSMGGILQALAVGDRHGIGASQWDTLTKTGTNHLVAVSGLHIGLIAGMVFFLVQRWFVVLGSLVLVIPGRTVAALAAVVTATIYAWLAGFSIPTQRAMIMVCVVMAALIHRRNTDPIQPLVLALILILLVDPFSVMAPGFWLSFGAIAVILYGFTGRFAMRGIWWKWGRVQWLVAVGLLPFLLLYFQQFSLISPVANSFAVPWVSFLVVPFTLLATFVFTLNELLGTWFFTVANFNLQVLWVVLSWMSEFTFAQWTLHGLPFWVFVIGLTGTFWVLLPQGFPGRWLGIAAIVPIFLITPLRPKHGEFWFSLLDVGQGLAAVVQTQSHLLLYDTGPKLGADFDAGQAVIIPYLKHNGVNKIDVMMISHGDMDHIGGAHSILGKIAVDKIISGVTHEKIGRSTIPCSADRSWTWDGVDFLILYPTAVKNDSSVSDNDGSCVLKVSNNTGSILLTGDIEKSAEKELVLQNEDKLKSTILVVPHHGSKTSSTVEFIAAVDPLYSLFPVGYKNRFGFPRREIVNRYENQGSIQYDTASDGAISFALSADGQIELMELYRNSQKRYWNRHP